MRIRLFLVKGSMGSRSADYLAARFYPLVILYMQHAAVLGQFAGSGGVDNFLAHGAGAAVFDQSMHFLFLSVIPQQTILL